MHAMHHGLTHCTSVRRLALGGRLPIALLDDTGLLAVEHLIARQLPLNLIEGQGGCRVRQHGIEGSTISRRAQSIPIPSLLSAIDD